MSESFGKSCTSPWHGTVQRSCSRNIGQRNANTTANHTSFKALDTESNFGHSESNLKFWYINFEYSFLFLSHWKHNGNYLKLNISRMKIWPCLRIAFKLTILNAWPFEIPLNSPHFEGKCLCVHCSKMKLQRVQCIAASTYFSIFSRFI